MLLRTHRRRLSVLLAAGLLATTALAAGNSQAATDQTTGWQVGTPPLTTPWTADVSPTNALPEYPRPQLTRDRWQNLNGLWQFAAATPGEAPPIGRSLAEQVLVPYPIESALSGIQRHEDRMWYRRTFTVPNNWRGQRLLLHFGAVDYDAKVWVNGRQVATHRGGYDGFDVDVTNVLHRSGPQELIVWAEDLTDETFQPIGKQREVGDHGIFYQGSSGIWRTVWMEPVNTSSIDRLQLTPELGTSSLKVTADTSGPAGLDVEVTAYDGKRKVATVRGKADTELKLSIKNPKLWSPDSPFLYDLKVKLIDRGRTVDQVGSYSGMRSVGKVKGADGKLRLALNGKILFNLSTLDQGFWPDGLNTAPTDEALRFDLEQHKELGFNTVRKHIKVEPDRWYYHADKLGLMVWQDMPASKTDAMPEPWRAQFEAELHEMVEEHKSFTSITTWVPFNEGWGEWNLADTGRIADSVKQQDPSRLVNAHSGMNCCNSKGDSGRGDMIDHHAYLGPATSAPAGERVAVDGEHGGFGLKTPDHMWFGDGFAYEMTPDKTTLTRRYVENQRDVLRSANSCGISGSVYTQITDVEGELNGFFTYDRQVSKMDTAQVLAVNKSIIAGADGTGSSGPPLPPGTPGADGIHFYPLDGTAEDAVGNNDATLKNGATFVAGKNAQGVALNGSGQFVDTNAQLLDTSGNYTAAAWVKLNKADGSFQTVVSQDGDRDSAFFLQYSGQDQRFAMSFPGQRALAPTKPNPGQWYHLTGVRDAAKGELRLYVDGELVATKSACSLDATSTGNTVIGRAKFGGNEVDHLDGTVDQVHLFDRALDSAEVRSLYDSGR
ncbi:MAG TPA: LamG-like jellyroll fold domain-containing protein [Kribbella sp.]|uniref:LamG-like jellyroll fold domain-containing protein n=1 Tax=Kribbella sp. TaxID=1871183 RepID=UPI002D768C14|nr:LamG-like jellyroll fold domain-containing protein [Kribbella sp.]HET6295704.1 LamG-like jellyroll fold domain-containing protein [Kribbella sp.]